jgi:ubiquitin carboxyl-terminal hydrolase 34
VNNDFSSILQMPEWQKLVQATESTSIVEVDDLATKLICNVLFERNSEYQNKISAAKCHASFARHQIERICSIYASSTFGQLSIEDGNVLVRKISLLDAVLLRSKHRDHAYTANVSPDLCLPKKNAEGSLCSTLQVYGGRQPDPKVYRLQYDSSTTMGDLLAALPEITGADESRVILSGQALDLTICADKELAELGLQAEGVIAICPKHTMESDLDIALTSSGAVEQEILAQWEALEKLIDGPDAIAKQVSHCFGLIVQRNANLDCRRFNYSSMPASQLGHGIESSRPIYRLRTSFPRTGCGAHSFRFSS